MFFVAYLYSRKDLAESSQELVFEYIVEFSPALREGIEERIEDRLS